MKPVKQYKAVKKYAALTGNVLVLSTQQGLAVITGQVEKVISEAPVFTFVPFKEQIIFQEKNGKVLHIYHLKEGNTQTIEGQFYLWMSCIYNGQFFVTGKTADGATKAFIIQDGTAVSTPLEETPNLMYNGVAYSDKGTLEARDINTGNLLWEKKFDAGLTIHGSLLGKAGNVIAALSNYTLLALDAATGKEKWSLSKTLPLYSTASGTDLLYGYGSDVYQVIDPAKGVKLTDLDLTEAHKPLNISPSPDTYPIAGNKMYFINYLAAPRFGALDVQTHAIDFVQDLEVAEGVTGQVPQYQEGRLYILDTENTLHVFET